MSTSRKLHLPTVNLSGEASSRSQETAESKHLYVPVLEIKEQGILTLLRGNALKRLGRSQTIQVSFDFAHPVASDRMCCAQDDTVMVPRRRRLQLCVLVNLDRAPGLIASVADILQRTIHAFRPAGDAQLAAMPDELMRE